MSKILKKVFSWLNQDLTGKSWQINAQHHYFGQMVYYAFKDQRVGYWECEIEFDGSIVSVIINSPQEQLPTNIHQEFVEKLLKDLDKTMDEIKPMMLDKLSQWVSYDSNTDWFQLFKLAGLEVPIDANANNDWELSFECLVDKEGHHLTCKFSNGNPEYITVDG